MKKKLSILITIILSIVSTINIYGCERQTQVYAIVTKSSGNQYNDLMTEGFQQVIENAGFKCIIRQPDSTTAEEQMMIINDLIEADVDSISIAANDSQALSGITKKAMEKGIKVTTFDSDIQNTGRYLFINQASSDNVGQLLMNSVFDLSDGNGQWAILSATNQAANQNAWINAMMVENEKREYKDLRLVDIVYGDDNYEKSLKKTQELIDKYPDLKVICAPTVIGIRAACEVVSEQHLADEIKVTGLGLPSEMAEYLGTSESKPCPYMYLWNPVDIGRLTAYSSIKLVDGSITGRPGESFMAGDMGRYEISEDANGYSQVIVGDLILIDEKNAEDWPH